VRLSRVLADRDLPALGVIAGQRDGSGGPYGRARSGEGRSASALLKGQLKAPFVRHLVRVSALLGRPFRVRRLKLLRGRQSGRAVAERAAALRRERVEGLRAADLG
jgi:hypothetical protein